MIEHWLKRYTSATDSLLHPAAIADIPMVQIDSNQRHRIPTAILLWYLRRAVQLTVAVQTHVQSLLLEAGQRGHGFDGVINGKPVWAYVYQFLFVRAYSVLPTKLHPTTFMSVNLAGYMGAVVKLAYQVQVLGHPVEEVIRQRQAHQNFQWVLKHLDSENRTDLSMSDLMKSINQMPLPKLSPADVNLSHQFAVHSKIPKQHRTLLHTAVMNNHSVLIKQLLKHPQATLKQDYWARTALHIAEIFSLTEIAEALKIHFTSQTDIQDGFGRTSDGIRRWKDTLHQSAIEPANGIPASGWSDHRIESKGSVQEIDEINYQDCSMNHLIQAYISCLKPVIIRGCPDIQTLRQRWTKAFIEHNYGSLNVEVGDIPYGSSLGRCSQIMSLSDHLGDGSSYAFCQLNPKEHGSLINGLPIPSLFSRFPVVQQQFYHGLAGTGAPMHMHVDAWNALVHGTKRWRISPPFQGVYSATPVQQHSEGPQHHTMEFTQSAGDIVYIPKYWAHEVYNLQENIGYATEFLNPYSV